MSLDLIPSELWTLRLGSDAVRCVASPHPMGVEVCYVMNEQPLIAQVLPDWADVEDVAERWRQRLADNGWVPPAKRHVVRH